MRVEKITFRKIVQVQQFEPEELTLEVCPEGTAVVVCFEEMRAQAELFFNGKVEVVPAKVAATPVETPVKKPAKKAPAKKAAVKKEETKVETPVKEDKPIKEETPVKEDKAVKTEKKVVTKKADKNADFKYDRTKQNHKLSFADILKRACPSWHTTKKAQGMALSEKLEGTLMFDKDGVILEAFEQLVIDGLK